MSNEKLTRDQQREAARAKAKAMREAQKKGESRKKFFIILGSVVIAAGVIAGAFVVATNQPAPVQPGESPSTAFTNGGVTITKDLVVAKTASDIDKTVPTIIIYQDLQCPACRAFEAPNMPQIIELVKEGKYNLELHPISFLDGASVNEYSSRAANAAICVAEYSPSQFFKYNSVLFENQPAELTNGPENSELIARAKEVGVSNADKIASCINAKSYGTWLSLATARALSEKIPGTDLQVDGTPFILVNGQQYTFETNDELTSPARFAQFLQTVSNN